MDTEALVYQAGLTNAVLTANLDGISHEESTTAPQPAGNCINWVVGHMVKARITALELIGKESPYPAEQFEMYAGGKAGPFEPTKAIPIGKLLTQFDSMQQPLVEGMKEASTDVLSAKAPFSPTGNPDETIGSLLATLMFHEAHHSGQVGTLRRLLGKPGALSGAR